MASDSILRISDEKTLELVELYKKEECLWNTTCPEYKNKMKRREAAEKIARILNIPNFEASHVMTKFKNLRNSFCQELKKMAISQNLSLDGEGTPARKLKLRAQWYTVLDSFIRPHLQTSYYSGPTLVINGGVIKREPEPEPMEDPDELWDNSMSEDPFSGLPKAMELSSESGDINDYENKRPASSTKSNSPKRMRTEDRQCFADVDSVRDVSTQMPLLKDDVVSRKVRKTQESDDVNENFAKYVASLLRLLPMRKALALHPKIVSMITEEALEEHDDDF